MSEQFFEYNQAANDGTGVLDNEVASYFGSYCWGMATARATRCLYLFGPPASALQALSKDKKVRDKFFAEFKLDCSAFDALASLDDKSALQELVYRHCLNHTNKTRPPTRCLCLKRVL